MKRLLHPFVLVVSAILVIGYAYIATRLTSTAPVRVALAAPFVMVWILPVVYWLGDRDRRGRGHEWVQALSFLCMGWLSFLLVLTVARDVLLLAMAALPPLAAVHTRLDESGATWVPVAALAAALRGPCVRRVDIPVEGLSPARGACTTPRRGWWSGCCPRRRTGSGCSPCPSRSGCASRATPASSAAC